MASKFQDDEREIMMCDLFDLRKDESEGRSGIDAFLDIDGKKLPFELKTTSNGSVTTVRDFGQDHIQKWVNKHWLIGFFHEGNNYYNYMSPSDMEQWIRGKEKYIAPDVMIASIAAEKLDYNDLYKTLGKKDSYLLSDAKSLQKKQYTDKQYKEKMDLRDAYSPEKMLEILKERTTYIMSRGSTLNNPHIPLSYFKNAKKIEHNHKEDLRSLVRDYLKTIN